MSALRKLAVVFGLSSIGLVLLAPAVGAHPLGNFSINTSAGVRIDSDRIRVDYVVDSAEVPTVQAGAELDDDDDGSRSSVEEDRYAAAACERTAELLRIEVDGVRVPLRVRGASVGFAEGKAGLETSRLECRLVATSSVDDGQRVEIDDGLADRPAFGVADRRNRRPSPGLLGESVRAGRVGVSSSRAVDRPRGRATDGGVHRPRDEP